MVSICYWSCPIQVEIFLIPHVISSFNWGVNLVGIILETTGSYSTYVTRLLLTLPSTEGIGLLMPNQGKSPNSNPVLHWTAGFSLLLEGVEDQFSHSISADRVLSGRIVVSLLLCPYPSLTLRDLALLVPWMWQSWLSCKSPLIPWERGHHYHRARLEVWAYHMVFHDTPSGEGWKKLPMAWWDQKSRFPT